MTARVGCHARLCTLLIALLAVSLPGFAAGSTLRIDVGTDANQVPDLNAAEALARRTYRDEGTIQVSVAGLTYKVGQQRWTFFPPGQPRIVIEAADPKAPPVFDGEGKALTWLVVNAELGRPSRLTLRGMTVQNYWSAVVIAGNRQDPAKWNGENLIEDMTFAAIGQSRPEQRPAFSALTLQRSQNNIVRNNKFLRLGNSTQCGGFHAIYIAHFSANNVISGNTFETGCGDVIKVRDASNGNRIERNAFINQKNAPLVDSYCDMAKMSECKIQECPSADNVFADNSFTNSKHLPRATRRPEVAGCPKRRN